MNKEMNKEEQEYLKYGEATKEFAIKAIELLEELTHKHELREADERNTFIEYSTNLLVGSLRGYPVSEENEDEI